MGFCLFAGLMSVSQFRSLSNKLLVSQWMELSDAAATLSISVCHCGD